MTSSRAQVIVDALLETSAIAPNPALDQLHRHWRQKRRDAWWSRDTAGAAVRQMMRDLDASGLSFEGEPDEKQRRIERTKLFPQEPQAGMYRNSSTMSRNRNLRRKSFGYSDYRYSLRDRGWPTAYRRPDGSIRKSHAKPIPVDEPQI